MKRKEPEKPEALERAEVRAQRLARMIDSEMGPGWGFSLQLWRFGDDPNEPMTYVSNCRREDMVRALRELLAKLEREEPSI